MEKPLLDRTYRLLDDSTLTYRQISEGAGVGYEWLKSFASRRRTRPLLDPVQKLHDFLATQRRTRRVTNASQNLAGVGNG